MGWAMRDRLDRDLLASVGFRIRMINGKNNGARPILAPLGLPPLLWRLRTADLIRGYLPDIELSVAGAYPIYLRRDASNRFHSGWTIVQFI
jgi:hypothetical protein